jgi:hypothetical protein
LQLSLLLGNYANPASAKRRERKSRYRSVPDKLRFTHITAFKKRIMAFYRYRTRRSNQAIPHKARKGLEPY